MEKKNLPLVTIVIPFHNNETTLCEAIESALSQTHRNIEVIAVDDFSTDNSAEVVNAICERESRLLKVANITSGVSAARNCGLKHSNGDFVVFLDADDILKHTYVEQALTCYTNNQELTIVYSNMERFERETGIQVLDEFEIKSFLIRNCIPIFAMVRVEQLKAIGGFDEELSLCEDWECWMHLLKVHGGEVYRIEEPQYFYRKRWSNDSLIDTQLKVDGRYKDIVLYVFVKHQKLYAHNRMSLDHLYNCVDDLKIFKRKYYQSWYRKLSYKLFKRTKYHEIYDNL